MNTTEQILPEAGPSWPPLSFSFFICPVGLVGQTWQSHGGSGPHDGEWAHSSESGVILSSYQGPSLQGVGGSSSGCPLSRQAANSSFRLIKLSWSGCGGWINKQSAVGCDGYQPLAPILACGSSGNSSEPRPPSQAELRVSGWGCRGRGTCSCQVGAC